MKALSDELRVRILAFLCENTAGPREIADSLGEKVTTVRYHVDELRKGGWIGDDPTILGRGGHYRAIRNMVIPPAAWDRLPEQAKHKLAVHILRHLYADVGASVEGGVFRESGVHLSLTPMVIDHRGQREVQRMLERTLADLTAIQRESDRRRTRGPENLTSLTVALFGFESMRDAAAGSRASATMRL